MSTRSYRPPLRPMSLRTARHLLWATAAGLLAGAVWSLAAVQPIAFLATTGLLIVAIPVDMALAHEIRYRAGRSVFGPVDKFGASEDAIHSQRKHCGKSPMDPNLATYEIAGRRPWWWRLWHRITNPIVIAASPLLLIPLGMLTAAPADADPEVDGYIAASAHAICNQLDHDPTFQGVADVGWFLIAVSGFTGQQAGEVMYRSVADVCPVHLPLISAFAADEQPTVPNTDVRLVVSR